MVCTAICYYFFAIDKFHDAVFLITVPEKSKSNDNNCYFDKLNVGLRAKNTS